MKNNIFKLLSLILVIILLQSCKENITTVRILPKYNVNSFDTSFVLNTKQDEVAPVLRPNISDSEPPSPYKKEYLSDNHNLKDLRSSSNVISRELGASSSRDKENAYSYLTKYVESLTFINENYGFVSFSHPPSEEFAQEKNIPINGIKGGTDLFEFYLKAGSKQFVIDSLNNKLGDINTEFWDSHPFAVDTIYKGKKITLLMWSSDRRKPYSKELKLRKDGKYDTINRGNTDIYYSFKENDNWTEVKRLEQGISTDDFNEGSPFIYCLCGEEQTLFFSSDRNKTKDNDYDIFQVRIKVDFKNKVITHNSQVYEIKKSDEAYPNSKNEEYIESSINSSSDDRFPFIPYPHKNSVAKSLYLTSNRNLVPTKINKEKLIDSVLVNVGGYDIYKFELKENIPSCVIPPPPPPPKLFLKVKVNEYTVNDKGDTTDRKLDMATKFSLSKIKETSSNEYTSLSNQIYNTNTLVEIDLASIYDLTHTLIQVNCAEGNCEIIRIPTPKYIEVNDTIEQEINCFVYPAKERQIDTSFSKAVAMFVTGYWWPLTTTNYQTLKQKVENKKLDNSQFIDPKDYKHYDEVVKRNDEWFESYYKTIEDLLNRFDECYSNQKLVITIHGFTDPCRLRPTANDEFTTFSSDGDITYNDVVIKEGTNMKNPKLTTTKGDAYNLPVASQQGNAVLALLRSHFTKETINKALQERFSKNKGLLDKYLRSVEYKLDYYGVYNGESCNNQKQLNNLVAMDLPNRPDNPETCNLPYSRRVMIYTDVINNSDIGKFSRNECGESPLKQKQKLKEVQILVNKSKVRKTKEVIAKDTASKQIEVVKQLFGNPELGCPGPCFWIQFGEFTSKEEFEFAKGMLEYLGYKDLRQDPRFLNNENPRYILISSTKESRPEIEKELKEFENQIKSMVGKFLDVKKLNCKIMPEKKDEEAYLR
jgi:hypothetical protein